MRIARFSFLSFMIACLLMQMTPLTQSQSTPPKPSETIYLLKPTHVFDGESAQLQDSWVVLVRGEKIEAVGPTSVTWRQTQNDTPSVHVTTAT